MPNRDRKSYNRLILGCLAVWIVVALSVVAIAGLGLTGMLLAIGWALGLGNITARCIDRRHPLPRPEHDPDDP
jgi:hypothetical protein